jgi:uncharacterized membrane protein
MKSRRAQLLAWVEAGAIAPERVAQALVLSGVVPDGQGWQRFMDRLLLVLGALTLATAVIFFFAYNWNALGKLAQFGLAEVLVVLPLLAYWKLGVDKLAAKVSLLAAAIMVGALLAVVGQTYQTGADTTDLFVAWAVLILPWVLVGQFPALWLLWLALLNASLVLYCLVFQNFLWISFGSVDQMLWLLLLLNSAAWVLWELASLRFTWLVSSWAVRLLAVASGTVMSMLVLHSIFEPSTGRALAWLAYMAWLASVYVVYRRKRPDLFMLAGACLSLIVCITTLVAKLMVERFDTAGLMLFLAMLVVAEAAAAAIWLKRVHAEMPR